MRITSVDQLTGLSESQLLEARDTLDTELRSLHQNEDGSLRSLNADEQRTFDTTLALRTEVQQRVDTHARLRSLPSGSRISGDGSRPSREGSETRSRALDLIERLDASRSADHLGHDSFEHATRIVERDDSADDGIARWVLIAGDEDYRAAYRSLLRDPQNGHRSWTPQQLEAYRRAEAYVRSMSLTTTAGGYLVPFTLDPNIILTSAGVEQDDFRSFCSTRSISTNTWNGVSSAGVTAEWIGEGAEVADASPTLAQPVITPQKADAFVPYSFEVGMDAGNLEAELAPALLDAKITLEANAFTLGTGTGQPKGIITAVAAVGGSVVSSTTADAFALLDIYKLKKALPARHRRNASWLASEDIYDLARQFSTSADATFWADLTGDTPSKLLGRPARIASTMDGTIDAAQTNRVLLYGDFQKYVIVDRVGTVAEHIPNLMGANRRPTGQRGLLLWWRVGADIAGAPAADAFRLLDC